MGNRSSAPPRSCWRHLPPPSLPKAAPSPYDGFPAIPNRPAEPPRVAPTVVWTPSGEMWYWPQMYKEEWGRIAWGILHRETIDYPDAPGMDVACLKYYRIYDLLNGLPCEECRGHALDELRGLKMDLRSRSDLVEWGRLYHNRVNARLGKPELSADAFRDLYQRELTEADNGFGLWDKRF